MIKEYFLNYLFELKKNQWMKREELDELVWSKIQINIKNAYENVPYYKDKFDKANINPKDIKNKEDLLKIPITSKKDIKEKKLSYISEKYDINKLKFSKTSGSTGEPFISYFDTNGWSILKVASKIRARFACEFEFTEKFVIVEAISVEDAKKQSANFQKKYLSVYDNLENHLNFYNSFKADSIYAFPSYLINLVNYLEEKNIKLKTIKRLFTSSEILNIVDRKKIEEYFECKIYDIYGCTETKEIAWECPKHEGYHINEDLVYVEIIKENGELTKFGEIGKILVTTLRNDAMPLIRYQIGDSGLFLEHKCSCGRTFKLMKPTFGREVDYFILKNRRKISPYEITMSMEEIEGIKKYQIIQKDYDLIEVNIRIDENFEEESCKKIEEKLKKILDGNCKIKIKKINKFNLEAGGKFRIVKTEINNKY